MATFVRTKECIWCSNTFTPTNGNGKLCSEKCRAERLKERISGYVSGHRPIMGKKLKKVGKEYKDYLDDNTYKTISERSIALPKTIIGYQESHTVPDLNFKRYTEPKKVVILLTRKETERSGW